MATRKDELPGKLVCPQLIEMYRNDYWDGCKGRLV